MITPFLSTFTIAVLLDFQDFTESPFARPLTFTLLVDFPGFRRIPYAFSLIVGFSLLPEFFVSFLAHTEQVLVICFGAKTVADFVVFQELHLCAARAVDSVFFSPHQVQV